MKNSPVTSRDACPLRSRKVRCGSVPLKESIVGAQNTTGRHARTVLMESAALTAVGAQTVSKSVVDMAPSLMEFPLLCSPYRQRDPILPPELVDIIASFLSHDNAYRTLANLYQTCHTLRDATLKTMYETLVVDDGNFEFAGALTNKRYDPPDWFEHVKLVAPITSLSLTLTASFLGTSSARTLSPRLALSSTPDSPPSS